MCVHDHLFLVTEPTLRTVCLRHFMRLWWTSSLLYVSSMTNIVTKGNLGREWLISGYSSLVTLHHRRRSGQELMWRPWRMVAHWFAPMAYSVCPFYTIQDH